MDRNEQNIYLKQRMSEDCVPLIVKAAELLEVAGDEDAIAVLADLVNRTFWVGVKHGAAEVSAVFAEHGPGLIELRLPEIDGPLSKPEEE